MKERKRRVYTPNWTPVQRVSSANKQTFSSVASQFQSPEKPPSNFLRRAVTARLSRYAERELTTVREVRLCRLRKLLVALSAFLTALSWSATGLCYCLLHDDIDFLQQRRMMEKAGICLTAFVQCAVLVLLWDVRVKFSRAMQGALHITARPVKPFFRNRKAIRYCFLECALHLVIPLPGVDFHLEGKLWGTEADVGVDNLLVIVVLMRNYHLLRVLFWASDFQTVRTSCFLRMREGSANLALALKFFLARHSLQFILATYSVTVAICGMQQYALERSVSPQHAIEWSGFWSVAITQTTIGYGDIHPETVPGKTLMVLSCFFGVFVLGMLNSICGNTMSLDAAQLKMYVFLAKARGKRSRQAVSIVLLQRWWRLVLLRKNHAPKGLSVILFFSQLALQRGESLRCRNSTHSGELTDTIEEFAAGASKKSAQICDYMRPVLHFQDIVSATQAVDVSRRQYRLKEDFWRLVRLTRRHLNGKKSSTLEKISRPQPRIKLSFAETSFTRNSTLEFAKSKQSTFLAVMGRLLRDSSCSSPGGISSSVPSSVMED